MAILTTLADVRVNANTTDLKVLDTVPVGGSKGKGRQSAGEKGLGCTYCFNGRQAAKNRNKFYNRISCVCPNKEKEENIFQDFSFLLILKSVEFSYKL